jgi:hypothetical protein
VQRHIQSGEPAHIETPHKPPVSALLGPNRVRLLAMCDGIAPLRRGWLGSVDADGPPARSGGDPWASGNMGWMKVALGWMCARKKVTNGGTDPGWAFIAMATA